MTNKEKSELVGLCKEGLTFNAIRNYVDCCDGTIRNYMKSHSPIKVKYKGESLDSENYMLSKKD